MYARLVNTCFSATAGAIVIDSGGRLLLLKHVFRAGSGWGIPGGFIHAGEQPEEAVRRELLEEVGLELESVKLIFIRTLRSTRQIEILFYCHPRGEAQPKSVEVESIGWFSPQELPATTPEDQRLLIERALRVISNE